MFSQDVLSKKLVVFSTIGSATVRQLEGYGWHPSVVIIDEAAQVLLFEDKRIV